MPKVTKPNYRVRCRVSVIHPARGLERVYEVIDLEAKDETEAKVKAGKAIAEKYKLSNEKVDGKLDYYSPETIG